MKLSSEQRDALIVVLRALEELYPGDREKQSAELLKIVGAECVAETMRALGASHP